MDGCRTVIHTYIIMCGCRLLVYMYLPLSLYDYICMYMICRTIIIQMKMFILNFNLFIIRTVSTQCVSTIGLGLGCTCISLDSRPH